MAHPQVQVFVVGSANLDRFLTVENFVSEGETIAATRLEESVGGKGLNQAVASGRAGVDTVMVGAVGQDSAGETLFRHCSEEKLLDLSRVNVLDGVDTGQAFIQIGANGNNAIVVVPGANGHVSADKVRSTLELATPNDVVVCQNEIPKSITLAALEYAKSQGCRSILNLAPGSPDADFLKHVDILIVNEIEAATLLGESLTDPAHAGNMAEEIHRRFGVDVVATLGERGAIVAAKDVHCSLPALPVDISDTTGAGDAFVGTFAALLAEGASIDAAARFGIAAATAACSAPGAQGYTQRRPEFEDLAQQVKPLVAN